ncbi:MAG: aspartate 1-decarboxylase [Lysobacterales bacterium]
MDLQMLKGKIHRATVTQAELDYDGSCAIDIDLLEAAGIREFERIEIYNITTGDRFATYAIVGERGAGGICANGAAAHRARPGDMIIICTYCAVPDAEASDHRPRLVYVDGDNRITEQKLAVPVSAA